MGHLRLRPSLLLLLIIATLLVGACLNPIMDPPLSYMLRFDSNGGVGALDAPYQLVPQFTLVLVGDRVALPGPGTITYPPDFFLGWNTRSSGDGTLYAPGDAMKMPSHDVTLYAMWGAGGTTYTVTYNANGADSGTVPVDQTKIEGIDLTLRTNSGGLALTGNTFVGWNTADDGSGTSYAQGAPYPVDANVALYAEWTALPMYTITYDANGATGAVPTDAGLYYAGEAITIAGQGALTNGTDSFAGWNTVGDGSGTAYAAGPNTMPAGALILYAQWSAAPVFNVIYDANGGVDPPIDGTPYLDGALVNILGPGTMTRVGYQFANWNTASDGSGTPYNPTDIYTIVAAGETFYAQWTQLFDVTFVSNGGSAVVPQIVPNGGLAADPGAPIRAGYTFNDWYADAGLTTLWNFAVNTVTANLTIYASWTANTYSIVFDAQGGIGAMPLQPVDFDATATLDPNAFTRLDHQFMGWSDTAGGVVLWNDGALYTHTIAANRPLYAVWEPVYTVTYTALLAGTGAPPVDANVYISGELVTVLGNPGALARTGYTLNGWTDGTNNYVAGNNFAMPSANVTLNPIWDIESFTLTYDGNGAVAGAVPAAGVYVAAEPVFVPGTGDLRGPYVVSPVITERFIVWNTDPGGSGDDYFAGHTVPMPAANTTLYAIWTANPGVLRKIGPGGGYVFYDQGSVINGWRWLEAAPEDQGLGINWSNVLDVELWHTNPVLAWGNENSVRIVNQPGHLTSAAAVALSYVHNGYNDWFLPSLDALIQMRTNLYDFSIGGPWQINYWSSQETAGTTANSYHQTDGTWNIPKGNTMRVRAVRAFRSTEPARVVVYLPNGADSGVSSVGPRHYESGETVTISNQGTLVRAGHSFAGWNTAADGSGADYLPAATPAMPSANLVLYAQWTPDPVFAGGDGSPGDPYQVATATQLNNVRNHLSASFLQTANINLGVSPWNEMAGWEPIGFGGPKFTGIYDGGNHTIDGMYINRTALGQGLFGYTEGASISNLRLTNVSMNVGSNNAGALVGANQTAGSSFHQVSATGTIASTGYNVGGLIGFAQNLTMTESYAQVAVTASYNAGGLVGNLSGGTIDNSYATGNVAGTDGFEGRIGGLIGTKSGTVTNSYAAGVVSTAGGPTGGLVGFGGGAVNASYYDTNVSGQSDDAGQGSPRTTSQMLDAVTFTAGGWNFGAIWTIDSGVSYPRLQWQAGADVPTPAGVFTLGGPGPAAGTVFYDKGSYSDGWRYMEAAPVDQSTSAEWGGLGILVSSFATAIGSGPSNTTMITGALGIGGYAAYIAQTYELNGFSDWFLPSRLELEQLYANRAVVGGFSVDGYWASSEADATYALFLLFNDGVVYSDAKNFLKSVRAVRRF